MVSNLCSASDAGQLLQEDVANKTCSCLSCRVCYNASSNVLAVNFFLFGMLSPRHLRTNTHIFAPNATHIPGFSESSSSKSRVQEHLPSLLRELGIPRVHKIQINVGLWDAFSLDDHRTATAAQEQLRSGVWFARVGQLIGAVRALASTVGDPPILWRSTPVQMQRDKTTVHADLLHISALGVAAACASRLPLLDWRTASCRAMSHSPSHAPSALLAPAPDQLHFQPRLYRELTKAVLEYDAAAGLELNLNRSREGGEGLGRGLVVDSCDPRSLRQVSLLLSSSPPLLRA